MAYIALGSNMGNRERFLAMARDRLAALPDSRVHAQTPVEETAPIGPLPQTAYLNQMLALETTLDPRTLLAALHEIERAAARVRDERWGPRTLDLDIVYVEGMCVSDPDLVIPHPELPRREFWARQLRELRGGA
jgi:2-amino-4-hydroxy-6-hydroxymethyldihydropteridine diphosphokinase